MLNLWPRQTARSYLEEDDRTKQAESRPRRCSGRGTSPSSPTPPPSSPSPAQVPPAPPPITSDGGEGDLDDLNACDHCDVHSGEKEDLGRDDHHDTQEASH